MLNPPKGFAQVLQRDQWRGVVAFSKAVDAPIVTSFAVSSGTRDATGLWQTGQAQRLLDLTREAGGTIAAAEFVNEPNLTSLADLPKGYDVSAYLRDFTVFHRWARQAAPLKWQSWATATWVRLPMAPAERSARSARTALRR